MSLKYEPYSRLSESGKMAFFAKEMACVTAAGHTASLSFASCVQEGTCEDLTLKVDTELSCRCDGPRRARCRTRQHTLWRDMRSVSIEMACVTAAGHTASLSFASCGHHAGRVGSLCDIRREEFATHAGRQYTWRRRGHVSLPRATPRPCLSHPAGRGLVFEAHRLVYHSTLGWRVIKKKTVRCRTRQYTLWREGGSGSTLCHRDGLRDCSNQKLLHLPDY